MARKAKGSGFKMKSGNKTTFKQMGSSPVLQQADATLVAAARHAAMQNVPKDLSAQYDKTAEGVIAAQKGKTEALTKLAQEAPGVLTAAYRGIDKAVGKIKTRLDFKKSYPNMPKQERRKMADDTFKKYYQEKHKDRKSISDIREITGAAPKTEKKKDASAEDVYKDMKYQRKIQEELNKQDPNKQDPNKQDPNKQDPNKQDPDKQDPDKQDPDKTSKDIKLKKSKNLGYKTGDLGKMKKEKKKKDIEDDWQQDDASMVEKGTDDKKEKSTDNAGGGDAGGEDAGGEDAGGGDAGGGDAGGDDSGSPTGMKRSFYKMKYNNKSFPFKK